MNTGDIIEKHYKFFCTLFALVILGCLAVVVSTLLIRNIISGAYISITVAPAKAKITLNGEEYGLGSHIVKAGKYDVKIEAEGFKTKEYSVDVKDGQVAVISDYLVHEKEGLKYYESSAKDLRILSFINSKDGDELSIFLSEYKAKTDIIYSLPIDASIPANKVTIRDGSLREDCNMAFCLVVEGFTIDKNVVHTALSQKGFDADNYTIIYDNLKEDK